MKLTVSSAPHITGKSSSRSIMLDVIIAMVPAVIASAIIFGIRAVLLTAVTVAASVVFEYLWNKAMKKEKEFELHLAAEKLYGYYYTLKDNGVNYKEIGEIEDYRYMYNWRFMVENK